MTRHATLRQICAVALLLLAGSPLTAPFSTCDIADLLGIHDSVAGPIIQSKVGPDDPLPHISGTFRLSAPRPVTAQHVLRLGDRPAGREPIPLPLRL